MPGKLRSIVVLAVALGWCFAAASLASDTKPSSPPAAPEVRVDPSASQVVVIQGDKKFLVDLAAGTVHPVDEQAAPQQAASSSSKDTTAQAASDSQQQTAADTKASYYIPGDVRLMTVPTGVTLPKGGLRAEFTHRFPFQAAFSGVALGHSLLGLDNFAIPSFGFDYGLTNRIELSVYRSPSFVGRPIEMRAAFKLLAEKDGQPLNLTARFSVDGQNDFERNFTTNFELIAAKSLGAKAQLYLAPTVSIHNRPLLGATFSLTAPPLEQPCSQALASGVPAAASVKPCADTFSIGIGLSVDVRPTVALFAEVDPTPVNGTDLGIHRPPYSFGIQKKIWRHAFTLGFTTAPGTTVAQRISTRSILLNDPKADKPSGMFISFNLQRQLR